MYPFMCTPTSTKTVPGSPACQSGPCLSSRTLFFPIRTHPTACGVVICMAALTNKVNEFLGKGGFGEVRVGEHQLTGERVALKFLRKSAIADMGAAERTTTEIQCEIRRGVRQLH